MNQLTLIPEPNPVTHQGAITFTVYGIAQPAGSKTAGVIYGRDDKPVTKNGRVITTVRDANPKSKDWKTVVAYTARQSYRSPLLEGPIRFTMTAYRLRPGGHFSKTTGAMSKDGRETPYPVSKPDLLKLARGIEDALTGIIWRDDSQIVDEVLFKRWGEPARIEVKIEVMR
jgi:Holliday junction resolvase RusA-like endonuclease